MPDYLLLGAIGFLAQLVDGALGMAFGVISTTAMLSMGLPPAQASAIVHTAEIFTTGASAGSHLWHRNVDWRLVTRLGIAGVAGAVLGAWVLSNLDAGFVRPYIAGYLLLVGIFIQALDYFKTMSVSAGINKHFNKAFPFFFALVFLSFFHLGSVHLSLLVLGLEKTCFSKITNRSPLSRGQAFLDLWIL